MNREDLERIEELKKRFNKKLENFELDKLCGQLSVDSICSLFPTEIILLLDYINQLETNIDEALKITKELYEEGVSWHWDNGALEEYVLELLSILEKGKEMEELELKYHHDEPALIDDLAYKVNELIKAVNELKKGK